MFREPFVWEVQVRREMVEDELAQLRELPYSIWHDTVGVPRTKTITGRDGHQYSLTVTAEWAQRGTEDIRVTVTLSGGAAPVRHEMLHQGFTIRSDNTFE